ncbi:MAG TPA: hypothetical protein VLU92_09430 [Candidatus Dormibacteraeota bacterium]|nr:hypothetical protein [Candidatus Dormibacteraeota bacterium]
MLIAALLAALVVMAIGGLLVKTLSVPAAAPAGQTVPGQLGASGFGSAWNYSTRRSGTQTVEGPAPAAAPTGSTFHAPGSRQGGGRQV